MEQGLAFGGFKPHAAHLQVEERFPCVSERPAVRGRHGVNLDLVVMAVQKRRGDLGAAAGFTAAELRFEPSKVRRDEIGHGHTGSLSAGGRAMMPFLSML